MLALDHEPIDKPVDPQKGTAMKTTTKKKALLASIALPGLIFAGTTVAGAQDAGDDTGTGDAVREHPGHRGPGQGLRALVDALGMDPAEVREALEGGATIAELADQQGVDIDTVIDQIVADAQAKADENPDSPRAQNFDAAELEQRLTDIVNGDAELPARGERGGPGGHRGGPGGFGPGGAAPADAASGASA